jgi:hypothetical protein
MRLDQVLVHVNRQAENLKKIWSDLGSGIIRAISEEEMKICREELDQRLITNNHLQQPREPSQQ